MIENYCKLCQSKVADKMGSHVVPHFLLKRIFNIEGFEKDRGKELGFTISINDVDSYFGRSVNPEKIEEVYGDKLEEKISNNIDPFIRDNIFCTACENDLAKIESLYSKQFTLPKSKKNNIPGNISMLFWVSIYWRLSITDQGTMRLRNEHEEILRVALIQGIQNISSSLRNEFNFNKISYKIIRSIDYSNSHPTFLVFFPYTNDPYILLIDEVIVSMSFSYRYSSSDAYNLFGFKQFIDEALPNNGSQNEIVNDVSISDFKHCIESMVNHLSKGKNDFLSDLLNKIHQDLTNTPFEMPLNIKQEFYQELFSEETRIGNRYTKDDINRAINFVLAKYYS